MNTKIMRALGMICRVVYPDGDIPASTMEVIIKKPLTGLAMLSKRPEFLRADQDEITELMSKIPADLDDPPNGVSIGDQGPFWIGFYQYVSLSEQAKKYGGTELTRAGQALYGDRWQSDLARDLDLDSRRIRQWLSGDRKIPASVWGDIAGLLQHRKMVVGVILDNIVGDK